MLAAIIGLVGTLLGSASAMFGAVLAEQKQRRNEEQKCRRDRLNQAYEQTLRYLVRAADRRSELNPTGVGVLRNEHHREWFDDLCEAHFWVILLTSYCNPDHVSELRKIADLLNHDLSHGGDENGHSRPICDGAVCDMRGTARLLRDAANVVADCARLDLAGYAMPLPHLPTTRRPLPAPEPEQQ